MSRTVVDVVVSGTTATVVDARVDGVTTVAGAAPVTNVTGQVPDIGVVTNYITENITLTSDGFNQLSGGLVSTGQYLTDEIAIVSGLTTGSSSDPALSGKVDALSGNLIATGAIVDDISGNLIITGQTLQTQITSNDSDISVLTSNLITTGQTLEDKKFDKAGGIVSGNILPNATETLNLGSAAAKWDNLYVKDAHIDSSTLFLGTGGANIKVVSKRIQLQGEDSEDGAQFLGDAHIDGGTLFAQKATGPQFKILNTNATNLYEFELDDQGHLNISGNLTGEVKFADPVIVEGSAVIKANQTGVFAAATNLVATGQTLTSEIAIVSGLTTGSSSDPVLSGKVDTLSGNLITTGQTLTTDINTVSSNLISTGAVVDDVSGNLITTGQTLTDKIIATGNDLDDDISTVSGLSVSNSNNLVTTGQTLQTQITSNDSDISTLTSNLITTGQTLTDEIAIVSGIATGGSEQDFRDLSGNLITTGQTLTSEIGIVSGLTVTNLNNLVSTGSVVDDVSGNLITTGQTLTTNINTVSTNLIATGKTLTDNIDTVSSNLVSTGSIVDDISGNLATTGQTLQTQITSNDGDITTLTNNLVITGRTLTTNIDTVSANLVSTGKVVDDVSGNLITTGQTLQTQITSNDSDISTLTSNLVTTGQTLTTNINNVSSNLVSTGEVIDDVSGNLGTTGQTLQTQITSNDGDITTLTSNLASTGNTLDTTTVKLTTNQSIAGNKIFTNDVTINNLTVTGTEVIVDVENLAVKDNIIEINSGESGAGISRISGGIVIDRGSLPNANILYNDANDRFELNFPLAVEGGLVASAANLISTGEVVDDISGNLITTGQTLQTQITSNDSDITTLTSNLVTTGQTLTTNINTVSTNLISTGKVVDDISGNLITTGQTLQTQITSNDTDITNLSSNLVTTGQTLTTNINTVANNLVTTGQTLTSEIATVSGLIPATVIDGGGTANTVPLWSDANTIGDSVISQSSSRIGIGTNAPDQTLHVNSAGLNFVAKFESTDDKASILIEDNDTLNYIHSQNGYLSLGGQNSLSASNLNINSTNGSVGVGTISPGAKLQIMGGTSGFDQISLSSNVTADTTKYAGVIMTNYANTTTLLLGAKAEDGTTSIFYGSSGSDHRGPQNHIFYTNASSTATSGNTERVRITSAGRVGIGSAAPAYKLEVRGDYIFVDDGKGIRIGGSSHQVTRETSNELRLKSANTSGFTTFYTGSDTEKMRIAADGNVGIGTNNPSEKLHAYRVGVLEPKFQSTNGRVGLQLTAGDTGDANWILYSGYPAAGDFTIREGGVANHIVVKKTTGSVGIGTDAPNEALEVNGIIRIFDSSATKGNISALNTSDQGVPMEIRAEYIALRPSASSPSTSHPEAMRIATGGNVGIGINAPYSKFEVAIAPTVAATTVNETADFTDKIVISNSGTSALGDRIPLVFNIGGDGADNISTAIVGEREASGWNSALSFWVNGVTSGAEGTDAIQEAMRINSSGNVGIGQDTPVARLQVDQVASDQSGAAALKVVGTAYGTNKTIYSYMGTTSNTKSLLYVENSNGVLLNIAGDGEIRVANQTLVDSANTNYKMTFPDNSGIAMGSAYTFANIYGSSGNLYLRANAYPANTGSTSTIYLQTANSSGGQASDVVVNNGAVGVGTASPSSLLELYSSAPELTIKDGGTWGTNATAYINLKDSSSSMAYIGVTGTAGHLDIKQLKAGSLRLYTNNSERFTIISDGKVGIGTTPVYAFEVVTGSSSAVFEYDTHANGTQTIKFEPSSTKAAGTSKIYSSYAGTGATEGKLALGTYSAQTAIIMDSGGRVGINVASPSNRFEVAGTSKFTGNVNIGAAGAGYDALFQSTTSGQYWEWDASMSLTRYRDNTKAVFGNGDDLEIYHDGSNSYVKDSGTGSLVLATSKLYINNAASNEEMISATQDGAVELFYDNSKKLETTTSGITVTGDTVSTNKVEADSWVRSKNQLRISADYSVLYYYKTDNSTMLGYLLMRADGANYLSWASGQDFGILEGNTRRVTIKTSTGYVGIGTDAPAQILHVYQTSGSYNALFSNSGQATVEIRGGENSSARLRLIPDEGDDVNNADHFQLIHETSNNFEMQRHDSGWQWKWKLDSSNNVHQTGTLTIGAFTIPNTDGSAGQVLQTNGSGTVTWATVTGGGGISGSGTDNYVPRWNGTTALQDSSIVALDSGIVGIGTNAPNAAGASTNNSILSLKGKATAYGGILELINYGTSGNGQSHGVIRFLDNTTENAQIEVLRHSATDDARMDFKTRATGGSLTTRLTIADDGNVGIGTTNPQYLLEVYGDATLNSSGATTDVTLRWEAAGATKWRIKNDTQVTSGTDHTLTFTSAGAANVSINQAGNVGIGTNNPEAALTVAHLNAHQAIFRTAQTTATERAGGGFSSSGNATAASRYARLFLDADGANFSGTDYFTIEKFGNSGEVKLLQYSNANMSFWVNTSTQAMTIKNDGNVGIGTNDPISKLHVFNDNIDTRGSNVDASTVQLYFDPTNGDMAGTSSTIGSGITWKPNYTNYTKRSAGIQQIGEGNYFRSGLAFYTNSTADHTTDWSERMRISMEGNVGIGTTDPGAKLHVYGGNIRIASTDDKPQLEFVETAAARWVIGNSNAPNNYFAISEGSDIATYEYITIAPTTGCVGIGTVAPCRKLHVWGTGDQTDETNGTFWFGDNTTGAMGLFGGVNNANDYAFIGSVRASQAYEPLILNPHGGEIGIHNTTPQYSLDVYQGAYNEFAASFGMTLQTSSSNNWGGIHFGYLEKGNKNYRKSALVFERQDGAARGKIHLLNNSQDGSNSATIEDSRMTIQYDGNVGIGTSSPGAQLHVRGSDGYLKFDTSGSDGTIKSDFNLKLYADDTGDNSSGYQNIQFYTAGANERMRIASDGHVGIGTNNPDYTLTVNAGTTNEIARFQSSDNDALISIKDDTDAVYVGLDASADIMSLGFSNSFASTNLSIDTVGNVGIGTISPALPLQVSDTGFGQLRLTRDATDDRHWDFLVATNGYLSIRPNNTINTSNEYITIRDNGNNEKIRLATADDSFFVGGSVGIGTNAPAANLHIYEATTDTPLQITRAANTGNAMIKFETGSTDDWIVGLRNDSTSNFRIYSYGTSSDVFSINRTDGNVGIGTNAPLDKLDVYGSGAIFRNLSDNADSVQIVRGTNHNASPDAKFYIFDDSSADWAAKINLGGASYGLDILDGADYFLLCRKPSDQRIFEIHGSSTVVNDAGIDYDFRVESDNDDFLLFTEGSTDRVAISTNTPAAKLHVEGDLKVGTTDNGNWMGYKNVTLNGTTYATVLTINLSNHRGCYVKLFLTGDWSSHSAVAFVGEYFVQNGSDGYAEPGTVISEFDNTNTDSIESKIVDPSSDTFTIQLKLSTDANGTLGGKLSYHVMGAATAVS